MQIDGQPNPFSLDEGIQEGPYTITYGPREGKREVWSESIQTASGARIEAAERLYDLSETYGDEHKQVLQDIAHRISTSPLTRMREGTVSFYWGDIRISISPAHPLDDGS